MKVCWDKDKLRGQANFDIDKDHIQIAEPSLFPQFNKSKKLRLFEDDLKQKVLNQNLKSDKEIYIHTITSGFLGSHTRSVLKAMKKSKKIKYKGRLALTYSGVMKDSSRKPVQIEIV